MYLDNIPLESKTFGINKLLITRGLTIDWKHRDSEIHLRTPELLDKISEDFTIKDIYKSRSLQLRHIYHLSRSVANKKNPNELINSFKNMSIQGLFDIGSTFFIDFDLIKKNHNLIPNEILSSSFVFSLYISQQQIIKYFVKHNLVIPKKIDVISKKELYSLLNRNISVLIYNNNTFTENEQITFWMSNFHLFSYIDGNVGLKSVKYKTDKNINFKDFYDIH